MITAVEARQLVVTSDASVKQKMEKIDDLIRSAAAKGETRMDCFIPDLYAQVEANKSYTQTPLQTRVMDELKKCGFKVEFSRSAPFQTLRGLGSQEDDDEPKPHWVNYRIVIAW